MSAEFSKLYWAIVSDTQMVYTELRNSNTDVGVLLRETVKHGEDTLLHVAANWRRRHIAEIIINLQPSLLFATNAKGETPLHAAAGAGSVDVTRLIIDRCHQIEAAETGETILRKKSEKEQDTVLHKAVRNGHLGVVKLLIDKDPELTKLENKDGESPLFMAVDTRQFQIAHSILTVSNCSFQGRKNMNVLHAAIARRSRKIVSCLIQKKEAGLVEQRDEEFGWTPLHYAAHMNDTQTIQQLVSAEHSVASVKDSHGMTALHIAAKQGHVSAVEKLVKICPEICGTVDNNGQSFFHIASKSGRIRVIRFILEKNYYLLFDLLYYIFLLGIFQEIGFSFERFHGKIFADDFLNMQDYQGNTALHLAALEKHLFILFLVARDRRFSRAITNCDGLTDWDIRIQSMPPTFLRDVNARLIAGGTPGIKHVLGKEEIKKKSKENSDKSLDLPHFNLLISTIIATVSFTAGLSVPGGFKNDGPDEGTAALAQKNDFQMFFIFNAIAFGLSITCIIVSRYKHPNFKSSFHRFTLVITQLATVAMVAAFIYGTSAVLGPSEAKLASYVTDVAQACFSLVCSTAVIAVTNKIINVRTEEHEEYEMI